MTQSDVGVARVDVVVDRPIGLVDRRIFGGFIEHLGRCIYGGVFDEGSPLADDNGLRTDVLAAVRELRPAHVRWPGGNFVSGYHWTDGIGPLDQRPRRVELAWLSEESNRFGTDEFMRWCRAVGTEPVLCLNMGTGTLDEALGWLEYCNGTGDTYWANLRRANGHPEPYRVRYWGLGNEMYGDWQLGQRSADDYVVAARQWGKALKRLDPGISLISCGQTGVDDWDRTVVDGLAPLIDFHSIHLYTGSDDYWTNVLAPHFAELAVSMVGAHIDRARYVQNIEHEIAVAYDEWNVWYRTHDGQLEERYNLSDALAVATYLNIFVRRCRTVKMANLAQMVNAIAPIVTSERGILLQTIYHPLRLVAHLTREVALTTFVDSGTHVHRDPLAQRWPYRVGDLGPFQLLDVAATSDTDQRRLTVSLVNRDPDRTLRAQVNLIGADAVGTMTVHEVNGDAPGVENSSEQPNRVGSRRSEQPVKGDRIDVDLAAHSFTVLEVDLV